MTGSVITPSLKVIFTFFSAEPRKSTLGTTTVPLALPERMAANASPAGSHDGIGPEGTTLSSGRPQLMRGGTSSTANVMSVPMPLVTRTFSPDASVAATDLADFLRAA